VSSFRPGGGLGGGGGFGGGGALTEDRALAKGCGLG
jgi:hypothetical protein